MEEALKIIITKSPDAAYQAIQCLQAIAANSPMVQQRYNRVVESALRDRDANFTESERAALAEYLEQGGRENRGFSLRVRLTDAEHAKLQASADQAGLGMSEYARRRIFAE